jgi:hypothetical protein
VLGQLDLLAPEGGEREVGNLVRKLIRGHACSPLIFWAFGCVFAERSGWLVFVSPPRYGTGAAVALFPGSS